MSVTRAATDRTQVLIDVVTRQAVAPDHPTRKRINHDNSSDRKWLINHLHWAMRHNVSVTLAPVETAVTPD